MAKFVSGHFRQLLVSFCQKSFPQTDLLTVRVPDRYYKDVR